MPDSSDIDNALAAKLGADSTLLSLMPNLVHFDEAPEGSTRFVIISLVDETDERRFEGRSHEDALFMVKAVGKSIKGDPMPDVKAAAARIDQLLEGGTLTVPGYTPMAMHRESRIRYSEVDEANTAIRWYHRGGNYRVVMST